MASCSAVTSTWWNRVSTGWSYCSWRKQECRTCDELELCFQLTLANSTVLLAPFLELMKSSWWENNSGFGKSLMYLCFLVHLCRLHGWVYFPNRLLSLLYAAWWDVDYSWISDLCITDDWNKLWCLISNGQSEGRTGQLELKAITIVKWNWRNKILDWVSVDKKLVRNSSTDFGGTGAKWVQATKSS